MAGTSILLGTAETERYEDAKEKSLEHDKTRKEPCSVQTMLMYNINIEKEETPHADGVVVIGSELGDTIVVPALYRPAWLGEVLKTAGRGPQPSGRVVDVNQWSGQLLRYA
jgi:hypothetical protein